MEIYQNQKTSKLVFAGRIVLAVASLVGALRIAGCMTPQEFRDNSGCWRSDGMGTLYHSPGCDNNWMYIGDPGVNIIYWTNQNGQVVVQRKDGEAVKFLTGAGLGMLSSGAGDIGDPARDLALRGAASGLQNAQQNEAIQNSGQVTVNVNNANQSTASDSSIQYLTNQKMTDGGTYTGQSKLMSDGLLHPHGHGVYTWPTGERYEGEWKDGKRNGQGVMTFPDGRRYEGEYKDDLPNGRGVMTVPTGEKYEGEWKDGKKNGQGVATWPDGKRYDGEWKDNKPWKLKGVYTWPDGTRYEGEWNFDGSKSGGKILWKDGHEYTGGWKIVAGEQDPPDGEGTMKWPDGRNYSGDFRDGKMHGFGKMVYADGRTEEGAWRDDKFVGSQSQVNAGDNQRGQGDSSKFGFVNVTADDPTFEVFADGAFVGNSPAKLKLSEGPHTIEVRKEGFKDYKKEIRVTNGSELNLRVVLEKQ